MTIVIDGVEHLEGAEMSAEQFYAALGDGGGGVALSTAQPSPATFVDVYSKLVAEGATEIVSVHLSEAASGTLNSARLAAELVDVPIHLVNSRMTSYGLGVLVLRIGRHLRETGGTEGVESLTDRLIPSIHTTFILQDLRYVLRGGRMRQAQLPSGADDIPVLGGSGGRYDLVGTGRTIGELTAQMADQLLLGDHRRHVAIALAAPDTLDFTEGLESIMAASDKVESQHRYRMGPSIAVHTGPGTAGGFSWPVRLD